MNMAGIIMPALRIAFFFTNEVENIIALVEKIKGYFSAE